jgi:hypothetical protein
MMPPSTNAAVPEIAISPIARAVPGDTAFAST